MPRRHPEPPETHCVVERASGRIVTRHLSLREARAAWAAMAYAGSLPTARLTPWAHRHLIRRLPQAERRASQKI